VHAIADGPVVELADQAAGDLPVSKVIGYYATAHPGGDHAMRVTCAAG
jgi:hypothetical protein